MQKVNLTVIIPFKNEEQNLVKLNKQLLSVLSKMFLTAEIIYVDDGSTDKSNDVIKREILSRKDQNTNFILITLRKNFGQTAAISAGVENASGELISFLDADLQNDPADIPR